jgi:hypothetical protein
MLDLLPFFVLTGLALLSNRLWRAYDRPEIKRSRYTRYARVSAVVVGLAGGLVVSYIGYLLITAFVGRVDLPILIQGVLLPGILTGMCLAGGVADTYAFIARLRGPSMGAAVAGVVLGPILTGAFFYFVARAAEALS